MKLIPELSDGIWTVRDTEGGRWWPDDDGIVEIEESTDPEKMAVALAAEDVFGEWRDESE